jgi:mono/diheme cytochrome c family protein
VKVPVPLRILALTVATTAFYTLVGQLVPQKEVQPPKETVLKKDMTPEELLKAGRDVMEGKGLCFTCHTVGKSGALRFPDLAGIGGRAGSRVPGLSDVDYLAQSIYEPGTFIVPGFNPGMPVINKPPIGLSDQEILAVIAYLQSMGGKVTVTLDSKVWPLGAGAAASSAGAPAGPKS